MSKVEYNLFVYFTFPSRVNKVISSVQKRVGYVHPAGGDPHVTLYLCAYSISAYKQLIKKLSSVSFKPLIVKISKLKEEPSRTAGEFFYVDVQGKTLQYLHEQVLSVANPLRGDRQRGKEQKRVKEGRFDKEQLHYLKKYGYISVLDRFRPHITIADLPSLSLAQKKYLRDNVAKASGSYKVSEFHVSLLKYTGTYETIAEHSFNLPLK